MASAPVPFVDLAREYAEVRVELEAALQEVAASGRYVLGPFVERFEAAVAERIGVPHAVGVASGTDALRLVLEALGIGGGDEVITSPFSFLSTAAAILETGARPVFADVHPATFNLDPRATEAAVRKRTAAIVPVHLFGQMAEMESFARIAARHGLALIEDAAQAFGAERRVPVSESDVGQADPKERVMGAGAVGVAGCFSFYPTKNLGGLGDGGLVATTDPELDHRLRTLRDHGRSLAGRPAGVARSTPGWELGHNSRLDAIQAAALQVKLRRVDEWNARRRAHAAAYDMRLASRPGFRPPVVADGNRHVYHQYTVRCGDRERVELHLEAGGIGYGVYYRRPLHLLDALAFLGYAEGAFPEAERAAAEALSLPVFPALSGEERDRVLEALEEAVYEGSRLDRNGRLG